MITIDSFPRPNCPNPKSHPFEWDLISDEHYVQIGTRPAFTVEFSSGGGGSDGDPFTLLNQAFSVDESTPFTPTTFAYIGGTEASANNFMDMLKSNWLFTDWYISKSGGGGNFTVFCTHSEYKIEDDFIFDYSSLSQPLASHTETNGTFTILADYSIWYQLWEGEIPVSEKRFGKVPFLETNAALPLKIDLKEIAGALVSTTFPAWSQSGAAIDVRFWENLNLRFGGITKDSQGVNVYGQTYESLASPIVNSVFQMREINEFLNHCPDGIAPGSIQWLTDRPQNVSIPVDSYAWSWIWIDINAQFPVQSGGFKVVYTFYYPLGVTDDFEEIIDGGGAHIIPTGTANPDIVPYIGDLIYYTVQIWGQNISAVWVEYSVPLTMYVKPGFCCEEEVYFIEDKGSFGTLCFEAIDEVQLIQEGPVIEVPLDRTEGSSDLYPGGGKSTIVDIANEKCFIISNPLARRDDLMKFYEQCLRSPIHYIRTTKKGIVDGIQTRRRIVIDRQDSRLFKKGEKTSIVLAYQYTTDLSTQ